MKALVVHDSDKVKDVFIGVTDQEILGKLEKSRYWAGITDRIANGLDEEEADAKSNEPISMDEVTSLYHDGDSQDGYTLMETK